MAVKQHYYVLRVIQQNQDTQCLLLMVSCLVLTCFCREIALLHGTLFCQVQSRAVSCWKSGQTASRTCKNEMSRSSTMVLFLNQTASAPDGYPWPCLCWQATLHCCPRLTWLCHIPSYRHVADVSETTRTLRLPMACPSLVLPLLPAPSRPVFALVPQHNMLLRAGPSRAQLQCVMVVVAGQCCCLLHVPCSLAFCCLHVALCLPVDGCDILLAAGVLGPQRWLDRCLERLRTEDSGFDPISTPSMHRCSPRP